VKPYYENNLSKIYHGNSLDILKQLPERSVNCCVTSPPYWGLRDYGTGTWVGGDPECHHIKKHQKHGGARADRDRTSQVFSYNDICGVCGAQKKDDQLGLEETPEQYVENMVELFSEVKRILRDDGTLWLNLGDSYYGGGWKGSQTDLTGTKQGTNTGTLAGKDMKKDPPHPIIKTKDLRGIPWRVAFALQADGWYLRQDIIWHKPNPMPESVTDRCTKAHEYIFLLSKSKKYYFNQDSILEDCSPNTHARLSQDIQNQIGSDRVPGKTNGKMKAVGRKYDPGRGNKNNPSFDAAMAIMPGKRNKRSVWTANTKPYSEAHFAVYPEELIEPCIKAGCPKGGTVFDPFNGSGTTLLVAAKQKKHGIGVDLSEDYIKIASNRLEQYRTGLTKDELNSGKQILFGE